MSVCLSIWGRGYPYPTQQGGGVTIIQPKGGNPHQYPSPRQAEWGYLCQAGWSYSLVRLDGGTPPPPPPGNRAAEPELVMWRAVCLLRSCRIISFLSEIKAQVCKNISGSSYFKYPCNQTPHCDGEQI